MLILLPEASLIEKKQNVQDIFETLHCDFGTDNVRRTANSFHYKYINLKDIDV